MTGAGAGSAGELRLEAVAGKASGFAIVVAERLVIGRQSTGPGKLADDPELSRHHAEIARVENHFTINDLSSTNGTFVNGTRLTAAVPLALGDEIEVGATKLVVRSVPVVAPPAPVDVRAATVTAAVPPAAPRPAEPATEPKEPMPETQPEAAPMRVHLTVDFEGASAALAVEARGEPIRLELEDGHWRVADGGG